MRRAQHEFHAIVQLAHAFQSSPDACAGRNLDGGGLGWGWGCFNPRPTHAPGATQQVQPEALLVDVSILARRMRRAQPGVSAEDRKYWDVSILARRMRRAQHLHAHVAGATTQFQSSPDACAGRNAPIVWTLNANVVFQSSPDACAGRNVGRVAASVAA